LFIGRHPQGRQCCARKEELRTLSPMDYTDEKPNPETRNQKFDRAADDRNRRERINPKKNDEIRGASAGRTGQFPSLRISIRSNLLPFSSIW